jgi:SAM-dependent methyltransferase
MDWADTARRTQYLAPLISGKRWLDFGCGPGYQLRSNALLSSAHVGVELNEGNRQNLQNEGFVVAKELREISNFRPQIVSIFHVLEHLSDPVKVLSEIYRITDENGFLLIEVPHARDFLLNSKIKSFAEFTLWSEHLILHTRESLKSVVEAAGWAVDEIAGVQRYHVWNHMAWISNGVPTGLSASLHDSDAVQLHISYQQFLASRDRTDTLILKARKAEPTL